METREECGKEGVAFAALDELGSAKGRLNLKKYLSIKGNSQLQQVYDLIAIYWYYLYATYSLQRQVHPLVTYKNQ